MKKKAHKTLIKLQNRFGKKEGKNTWILMKKNGEL